MSLQVVSVLQQFCLPCCVKQTVVFETTPYETPPCARPDLENSYVLRPGLRALGVHAQSAASPAVSLTHQRFGRVRAFGAQSSIIVIILMVLPLSKRKANKERADMRVCEAMCLGG